MTATDHQSRDDRRAAAAARAKQRGPPVLPEWPADKPRPGFASLAEERQFLSTYSFADYWIAQARRDARGAKKRARAEVYRLRLSSEEREALEARARQENVPISQVLRELIAGLRKQVRVAAGESALLRDAFGSFAHLTVENLGAPLMRVRCWVQFFRANNPSRPLFSDEMPARWSWAPEPFSGTAIDPYRIGLAHTADFAPRESHAVAIAVRFADGTCWGWTPDSYVHGGMHPNWKLPAEPLIARARVVANGQEYFEEFCLSADQPPKGFTVKGTSGSPVERASSALRAEVDQVTRFEVIKGGKT